MNFAISTHWNAHKYKTGRPMIEEILELGFQHVELGYNLTIDLVGDVRDMVKEKAITVVSVHNYCPVPIGAPYGHPELFDLSSPDLDIRMAAVHHTKKTIEFASEVGATTVVTHSGNVDMSNMTSKLVKLYDKGKRNEPRYEKTQFKLYMKRSKRIEKHKEYLYRSLEELLPALENSQIQLGLENLPTWESIPTEEEAKEIMNHFNSPWIRYWHDIGHGQTRENLGFISHTSCLGALSPWLAGMHIHDVNPPNHDHIMPPQGTINFERFKPFAESGCLLVFEPASGTSSNDIAEGLKIVKEAWAS